LRSQKKKLRRGKKWRRNVEEQKKTVAAWDVVAVSQQIDAEPS
jgi:hypothetical protein